MGMIAKKAGRMVAKTKNHISIKMVSTRCNLQIATYREIVAAAEIIEQ